MRGTCFTVGSVARKRSFGGGMGQGCLLTDVPT